MTPRQSDNQTNVFLALVLSMIVILGWQYFYAEPRMREERERQKAEQAAKAEAAKMAAPQATPAAGQPAVPGQATPGLATGPTAAPAAGVAMPSGRIVRASTRDAALALAPRIRIGTPALLGSIGLKGGRIDDLRLVRYRDKVDPASPTIELFSPSEAPSAYFVDYGWIAEPGATPLLPNRETVWTSVGAPSLTPTTPVDLTWDNGQGLVFKRRIAVDENYMFTVSDEVENRTGQALALRPYARIFRDGPAQDLSTYVLHEGLVGYVGTAGAAGAVGLVERTFASFAGKDERREGFRETMANQTGGWLGVTDKYWAATLIPDQKQPYTAMFSVERRRTATETDQFETRFETAPVILAPGATAKAQSKLYAGAKNVVLIDRYAAQFGIERFNLMIDWGWFYFITKPLFYLLDWLYGLLGNFGLAIIGVTIIVKALFFWPANLSYASMAKMKKVQPEMERLKERYKDDKERQAKELMALYAKEGINPLSGCLPILLQIPVFFALYKVLYGTIDMRHAPFFGWVRDLSAPDPTSLFNLFGLLPYAVPDFLVLGIWPIVMGLTMWVQMQLSPPPPDPIQQQVFAWMPPMLTVMLATAPAGLVIYWAVNNVLSIAQQAYIMKKYDVDIPIRENMMRQWNGVVSLVAGLRGKKEDAKG
jgi:YidC/Oxa1 family membrane protein insertase